MALEKDLELLDNYVGNRMDAAERTAFEQKLQNDPALLRASNAQQKIVEGIRQARIAELKTMLNNVPVTASYGGETSVLTKTLAGLLIAGAVGTGIYFYLQHDAAGTQQAAVKETPASTEQPAPAPQPDASVEIPAAQSEPAVTPHADETVARPAPASKKTAPTRTQKQTPAAADSQQARPAREPKIQAFDPSEEAGNAKAEPQDVVVERAEPSSEAKNSSEVVRNHKKYNFHYQFKEGRLILYGSFEKNLYEIMEFFSDNKRTMFLFYKDNYYLLNEQNEKVKPLVPINDTALLKKLRDSRGN